MMSLIADYLSWTLLITGSAFCLIGAFGLIRLPDVFSRMHGSGIIDTLGAGLILGGLMIESGFNLVTVKLALIIIFLLYTSPATTHALARAALHSGIVPVLGKQRQKNKGTASSDSISPAASSGGDGAP